MFPINKEVSIRETSGVVKSLFYITSRKKVAFLHIKGRKLNSVPRWKTLIIDKFNVGPVEVKTVMTLKKRA